MTAWGRSILANSQFTLTFLKRKLEEIVDLSNSVKTKGSFVQNFAITFSGSAITIIAQMILTPIITRIYGPEAYGIFGIFNAIVMNLAMVATLMYEQALILPKKEHDFKSLLQLTIWLSIIFSSLIFIVTFLFGDSLLTSIGANQLQNWKYLIAPAILILCFNQVIGLWVARIKEFKKNVPINTGSNIAIRAFNIGYGILYNGAIHGLIFGELFGKFSGLCLRVYVIIKDKLNYIYDLHSLRSIFTVAINYINYPKYVLPASWINLISSQIPIFFLAKYFDIHTVGYFALANSLLELPLRLFGYSLSPVFMQKATELSSSRKKLKTICSELYNKLFNIGVLPFVTLMVFGEEIFSFVLGQEWRTAGLFASYLGIYYIFRLVNTPLDSIYKVLGKEKLTFYFSVLSLSTSLVSLTLGILIYKSAEMTVLLFSMGNLLVFVVNNSYVLKLVGAPFIKIFLNSVVKMSICFALIHLLKIIIQ